MGLYVMSKTEMGTGKKMENNGYVESCLPALDDQEIGFLEGDKKIVIKGVEEKNIGLCLYSSSSESSIGKNSDEGLENVDHQEEEVQSSFSQDGAFDCLQALEEALPLKRGLSSFYNGRSKSYKRLDKAPASSSIKAIAKPEDAYSRKRKLSIAMEGWRGGGESKRPASFSSLSAHYSQLRQTKFNSSCHKFSFADSEQCGSLEASAPV